MEFSKTYRQAICNDLIALFKYNGSFRKQTTYFMSGDIPEHEALHAYIRDEWNSPQDGIAKAPDHVAASLHSQFAGKSSGLFTKLSLATAYDILSLPTDLGSTVSDATVHLSQPVGVEGVYDSVVDPKVEGFIHADKGNTVVTWALTLWGDETTESQFRNWYVMHHVGTVLDPLAEIVVFDNILREDDPELRIGHFYSPVF